MYELIQVGNSTYYVDCPSKMGIYVLDNKQAYLIDSGNDRNTGRKIEKILDEQQWELKAIISTHSHSDHIGGNNLLQNRRNCPVYSLNIENSFIHHPILEPSFLYGGYPCKDLQNKYFMAAPSIASSIEESELPAGIDYIRLDGHSFAMLGIKTPDNIWFIADALVSENTINKYHIPFLYDISAHLKTLETLEQLDGALFVPAHSEATKDLSQLIEINRNNIYEIINHILEICLTPTTFEDILQALSCQYHITMDIGSYVLIGSTVRSYLSYLNNTDRLNKEIKENKLYWSSTPA